MYILYYREENGELLPSMSDDKSCECVLYDLVCASLLLQFAQWTFSFGLCKLSSFWTHICDFIVIPCLYPPPPPPSFFPFSWEFKNTPWIYILIQNKKSVDSLPQISNDKPKVHQHQSHMNEFFKILNFFGEKQQILCHFWNHFNNSID
jgi:hypothetical protein